MIASLRAVLTAFVVVFALPAMAATFEVRRSISTDLWVDWPDVSRWNDVDIVRNFPEWRRHAGARDFARLKAAGFDTIRVPLEPAFFLYIDDPAREREVLRGVDRAVASIVGEGLNVIVDLHTIPRGDEPGFADTPQLMKDDGLFDRYSAFAGRMAAHLQRWPAELVALEVINEPTLDCYDGREQARWAERLVNLHGAVRTANADITLVLTGACWGSADGLAALDPATIDDDNILWSFHSYEPFIVTHQGAGWVGEIVEQLRDIPWPPSAISDEEMDKLVAANEKRIRGAFSGRAERRALSFLRDNVRDMKALERPEDALVEPFDTVAEWADQHGIARERIFLGEFGMIGREAGTDLDVPAHYRLSYMRSMIALAEEHGFGWSVWSFGGAFGLVQAYAGEPLDLPLYNRIIPTLTD